MKFSRAIRHLNMKDVNRKQLQKEKALKERALSEEPTMNTSNIYPETSEVENQDFSDFEAISFGGQGLGFSGADGNNAGNAAVGVHLGLEGVAFSPPHPVTGVRNSASHVRNGTGQTTPLRPGKTTTRGDGNNPPSYTMGSCLWFYDSDFNNGAGQPAGKWCNLEFSNFEGATNGKWFFWDTNDNGFFFPNIDLSQHHCGDISGLIAGLNFPGTGGAIGAPQTIVITQKGLETEPIYPGPIATLFGLGQRGLDWLLDKVGEAVQAVDDFFSPVEAYLDATPPFLGFLIHQVNPNSPFNEENPFPVEIADDQKNEIKTEIEEIFNEWGSERVEEINGGSPMTNEEMNQVNEKINRNIKTGGNDATDSKFPSYRLTVNNIGNPNAFEGNIKTNEDGSQTPTAIEDNYVFEGDDDAAAPGAPTIIKTLLKNKGVQEAIKNSGLSYPYRVDDSPLPVGEKPILQNKNMPIRLNLTTPFDGMFEEKKLLDESVKLGHFEPDILDVDIKDIRKGIMPEYPKQPPAEMIDGYHQKSPLRPKPLDNKPYVKITKADLIRNHRIKPSEVDEMMDTINRLNDYIKKHPEDLIYVQQRYPKDDPRLAELNWKMDQMLEAGEEYLDSNFKENQTLYKRATEHTLKNIKITDPKYAQQRYDELRGTTKPKKTNLVGRLGKHLNKYESKGVLRHVDSDDFKKISERKLEKKKFLEKQEQERLDYINDINAEMDEFRSDWRKDISESDFTNITKGNKVGQTFQHTSGATITLDNTMSDPSDQPSQVTLDLGFGEKITVDAPSGNEYGIAGVTKPLDKKVMQKQSVKTAKEINDQIDASEKASESKSTRVPTETGDLGYKSTDEILADVGDQWTYPEYIDMMNKITIQFSDRAEPLEKLKQDYIKNNKDVPISIVDAIDAIVKAQQAAYTALDNAWERYNKVPDLPDEGDKSSLLDNIASKMKVGTAKNVFDLHLNYLKNPTGKVQNINNLISKKDINALSKTITNNATIDQLKFDVRGLYGVLQNTIDQNSGLRNSLGNLDQSKIYLNDSQTEVVIEKPYDFSGLKDLQGAGDIKTKVGAPVYAGLNVLQGKMSVKDFFTGTDTMMIRVNIPIKKKKVNESTAFSKIKKFRNKY